MVSTIRIDQVSDPLTVMDKEVYDPTGREADVFTALDLKVDAADPVLGGPLRAPVGTQALPAVTGPSDFSTGMRFPVAGRISYSVGGQFIFLLDTNGVQFRRNVVLFDSETEDAAAHAQPQVSLFSRDKETPTGAGPWWNFQSYNSALTKVNGARINGGLQVATAGSEGGCLDFVVMRNGAEEVAMSVNGAESMVGSALDNVYDFGRAAYRWANGFFRQLRVGAGGVIWTSGSGNPEGVVTAPVGSLFTRTDGSTSTTLYVKTSGSGNTGWTAK